MPPRPKPQILVSANTREPEIFALPATPHRPADSSSTNDNYARLRISPALEAAMTARPADSSTSDVGPESGPFRRIRRQSAESTDDPLSVIPIVGDDQTAARSRIGRQAFLRCLVWWYRSGVRLTAVTAVGRDHVADGRDVENINT